MEILTFIDNSRIERDKQTDDFRIIGKLAHKHYFKTWDKIRYLYPKMPTENQSILVEDVLMSEKYDVEDVLKFEVI